MTDHSDTETSPSHCPSRTASPGSSPAATTRPSPTPPTASASTSRWTAATAPAAPARRSASRAATTAAPTSTTRCPRRGRGGYVLPCSMKPRSDLVLQIASTSDVAKTQAATYTRHPGRAANGCRPPPSRFGVEIPNRARVGVSARAVRQHRGPRHRPDAFLLVLATPRTRTLLTFLVKLTPGGAMSDYLDRARGGR